MDTLCFLENHLGLQFGVLLQKHNVKSGIGNGRQVTAPTVQECWLTTFTIGPFESKDRGNLVKPLLVAQAPGLLGIVIRRVLVEIRGYCVHVGRYVTFLSGSRLRCNDLTRHAKTSQEGDTWPPSWAVYCILDVAETQSRYLALECFIDSE